jgi:hypothetical protein
MGCYVIRNFRMCVLQWWMAQGLIHPTSFVFADAVVGSSTRQEQEFFGPFLQKRTTFFGFLRWRDKGM